MRIKNLKFSVKSVIITLGVLQQIKPMFLLVVKSYIFANEASL